MTLDRETVDELAEALYAAHRDGEPIDPLTANHDLTAEDAYAIQSRLVERRVDDGATVVGHKVGLTSEGIQNQLGVDTPDFGRLLDTMFVEGRQIPAAQLIEPRVEPEIALSSSRRTVPTSDGWRRATSGDRGRRSASSVSATSTSSTTTSRSRRLRKNSARSF